MGDSSRRRSGVARIGSFLVALGLTPALVSCGSDEGDEGYGEENREAFLAACTSSDDDPRLIGEVCECAYDRIEAGLPFSEFVALEEAMAVDSLAALPDDIADFVAGCFVEEVDL